MVNKERTIYTDLEQGSDEWHKLKEGRISSTSIKGLLTKGKDTYGLGVGMLTCCDLVIAERKTGSSQRSDYSNEHMQNGVDLEEHAVNLYEFKNFCTVIEIGFISMGEYFGDSPDRHIDDDSFST